MQNRPLSEIAKDIRRNWKKIHYSALPYLAAMDQIDRVSDFFMYDSGHSVVRYFLSNARTWKGAVAATIKEELRECLNA